MRRSGPVSAALGLVLLSGCVVASPDDDTYRDAAVSALTAAASEVATVETMVDLLRRDRITRPVVIAQLRYSEAALHTTAAGFESLNPPRGHDTWADSARTLFGDSADQLQDARRAIRRHDVSSYQRIADDLDDLVGDLQSLKQSIS